MKQIVLKIRFNSILDTVGFSSSTLCAIHCAILPFVMSILPILGIEFVNETVFEWTLLGGMALLALLSFLIGYYKHHHDDEPLSLMLVAFIFFVLGHPRQLPTLLNSMSMPIGGVIIAYAHYRNWKLCKRTSARNANRAE